MPLVLRGEITFLQHIAHAGRLQGHTGEALTGFLFLYATMVILYIGIFLWIKLQLAVTLTVWFPNMSKTFRLCHLLAIRMAMLSRKTPQEISELLDEYGIKHGPVVESTRALYEKKLRDAMAKDRRTKPFSDRTYYREEEDVTYINHRKPVGGTFPVSRPLGHDGYGDRATPSVWSEYRNIDKADEPIVLRTHVSSRSTAQSRLAAGAFETQHEAAPGPGSVRFVPIWMQITLFLVVAGFLVFVFLNMETADTEPLKKLA